MAVQIDELDQALQSELKLYSDQVTDEIKQAAKDSAKDLVQVTKRTAPVGKRRKHYRDSITYGLVSQSKRSAVYAWYVKGSDYRLSHLLEDGHQLKNGGRYAGTKFISKAVNKVIPLFEQKVEEVLNRDK